MPRKTWTGERDTSMAAGAGAGEASIVESAETTADILTGIFGGIEAWRVSEQTRALSNLPPKVIRHRVKTLDTVLGRHQWVSHPNFLCLGSDMVAEKARLITELFQTDSWRQSNPLLLLRSVETLRGKIKVVRQVVPNLADVRGEDLVYLMNSFADVEKNGAEVAVYIKSILSPSGFQKIIRILAMPLDIIKDHEARLFQLFSDKWKQAPELLLNQPAEVEGRVKELDEIFGQNSWRGNVRLALQEPARLRAYAEDHTREFGSDEWKKAPPLISVTPQTFNASLRAMENLGLIVRQRDSAPGEQKQRASVKELSSDLSITEIVRFLTTTNTTKREKALLIRREILGHKETSSLFGKGSVPIGEYVSMLSKMTPEEKEAERQEVIDFVKFITENPAIMGFSMRKIIEWGRNLGYIKLARAEQLLQEYKKSTIKAAA